MYSNYNALKKLGPKVLMSRDAGINQKINLDNKVNKYSKQYGTSLRNICGVFKPLVYIMLLLKQKNQKLCSLRTY